VGVKYVVFGRMSQEAIEEIGTPLGEVVSEFALSLPDAIKKHGKWQSRPLLILDGPGDVQEIGMMYAEVLIEDENGNRVKE
jgi:hypothetical protein